jgi:hypothetical protein
VGDNLPVAERGQGITVSLINHKRVVLNLKPNIIGLVFNYNYYIGCKMKRAIPVSSQSGLRKLGADIKKARLRRKQGAGLEMLLSSLIDNLTDCCIVYG